jgi:hypothetical protein
MNRMKNGIKIRRTLGIMVFMAAALTAQAEERWTVTAELAPGEKYSTVKWFGIMPVKLVPQMALWIENTEGGFRETIYSTRRNSENDWRGAEERAEALPVYNERRGNLDALGGASPKGKALISLEGEVAIPPGKYVFYGEVNKSFDYNDAFPEETSGVNGQPSLVYRGEIDFTGDREIYRVVLSPVGTGSVDGSHGEITSGTAGLTTGLSILQSMELVLKKK